MAMESCDKIPEPEKKAKNLEKEVLELKESLPKELWFNGSAIYLYQGFWAPKLDAMIAFQNHFKAHDTDVFITSTRKAGTTWLKALIFAICNRENYSTSENPLLYHNPHHLVPQLESNIYAKSNFLETIINLKSHSPRLFGTHLPYHSLPTSIDSSKSKIVYIIRNPLDTMISSWLFYQNVSDNQTLQADMFDIFVDMFSEGKVPFGPFPDHVLGYWEKCKQNPDKILFVKYEDLKVDPIVELKRIAKFVECPFSAKEEESGLIDEIVNMCSFQSLKLVAEVNKADKVYPGAANQTFFRNGVVGDWIHFMTPLMAERFNKIMFDKFGEAGSTFM